MKIFDHENNTIETNMNMEMEIEKKDDAGKKVK